MVGKLIYNVAVLFIMMLPGIIMKKCKLSTDGLGKGLSNLVLYIAQPALIFNAYVRPYDSAVLVNAIWVFVFSIVAHVIFTVITLSLYKKEPDATMRMLRFATIFSNAAFMGIPLIQEVLGADATIYASIYNITFNAFLWTLGVNICTKDRDIDGDGISDEAHLKSKGQGSIVKAMLHPTMIAAFLGLFFFFLPIEGYIPAIVSDCLTRLANLVGPLSMVVLGLRLADIDLKGFFKEKSLYIFISLRHVILPVIIFAIIRVVMMFLDFDNAVLESVLIMASAPAATSATMFAEKYDCDAAYVSKIVAVSTILSLATMPLIFLLTYI